MNLRIPGPTPVPKEILRASAQPMINHRGPEFAQILSRVTQDLKVIFETEGDVLILTASGTGAMEAAIVNTLSPGDQVLSVSIGVFGNRFADIAETYGAVVTRLDAPWGSAADPALIRKALATNSSITAVLVTHNETSTGVTNDLEAIAQVVKGEFNKLLLVDAVSSLPAIPLPTDRWVCDVVVSASQKGWGAPPGLAFASMNSTAWKAYERSRMPKFYFDLGQAKTYLSRGQNPWTPAISTIYAMDAALQRILTEGLPNMQKRHAEIAEVTRKGLSALGFPLFADRTHASDTVTAVSVPQGIDGKQLVKRLREEQGVVVAGGQQHLEGKILRIGHMGHVTEKDIQGLLDALTTLLS